MERVPPGATRVPDRIPQVLGSACGAQNDATFNFCQHCVTPPYRGLLEPRVPGAALVIDIDRLEAHIEVVRAACVNKAGQRLKSVVADEFVACLRAHTAGDRGWESATDADVDDWLCWLDSHGNGTKIVHAVDCVAIGSTSLESYSPGSTCAKRYVAQTLGKGFVVKL